jgi:hypothetical protein
MHAMLNRNIHDAAHREAMPTDCESISLRGEEEASASQGVAQPDWHNLGINAVVEYDKFRKENPHSSMHDFLRVLSYNLKVIDTLQNGDIIKLEGTKLMNVVLYHHAAIISSKLIFIFNFNYEHNNRKNANDVNTLNFIFL